MSPPESYLVLRRGLLVRLAASGALLVAAVVAAWSLAPGAGGEATRASPAPVPAAAGSVPSAPPPAVPAASARPVSTGGELADAMQGMAELEPLHGKSLEVLVQRPADGAQPAQDAAGKGGADEPPKAVPQTAKLPRGPHLQAGIFASHANAEEMKKKLETEGYSVYLETRVHVGPFPSRKDADKAREKLKEQGATTVFIPQ